MPLFDVVVIERIKSRNRYRINAETPEEAEEQAYHRDDPDGEEVLTMEIVDLERVTEVV